MTHEDYMDIALTASREAHARGDWPVASPIVKDGEIIGRGQNEQITRTEVTWHAETAAIRDAQQNLGTSDVSGGTLYGPMEPCPLCARAVRIAGIDRLVLALRHATRKRTDMGSYSREGFARLVGWQVEIIQKVREAEYLALRRSSMDPQINPRTQRATPHRRWREMPATRSMTSPSTIVKAIKRPETAAARASRLASMMCHRRIGNTSLRASESRSEIATLSNEAMKAMKAPAATPGAISGRVMVKST